MENVCGPASAGIDIATKDRLSRSQQVICAANDADGENGRCPVASQSRALNTGLTFSSQDGYPLFLQGDGHHSTTLNTDYQIVYLLKDGYPR